MDVLTLDAASAALCGIKGLKILVIHTCQMSHVEALKALDCASHHLACESQLKYHLHVSDWFGTLSDSASTPEQVLEKCLASIRNRRTRSSLAARGTFSAHKTTGTPLLSALNTLGSELTTLLQSSNPDVAAHTEACIEHALAARIDFSYAIDLAYFCSLLVDHGVACATTAKAVRTAVRDQQLADRECSQEPGETDWGGIAAFFPNKGMLDDALDDLPQSFKSAVPLWIRLLQQWGRVELRHET
jgi:hypothetical protein